MTTAPLRLRTKASWLVNQAATVAHRLAMDEFVKSGSRRYHYGILAAIDENGPSSQATLSRCTGIDRSDVVAVINELAAAGHVDRSPDPADARRNLISLTEPGAQRLDQLEDLVRDTQDTLLAPLDPAEREQLTRLLARVVEHHNG
ncbi:MarR family transcriptional regulator [Amycolatopsis sp. WAC 01376]|uniref:MarR family winged helix-turn-helix transcriptional regulator n=1 Tax=Amycolatopsis sp. WAC 01376 TaxID=2203195 RepID=UPI000F776196|nr:MarR family winged helix-turn-helix transcriptional regulator [Amycolatopsis sp. WAC 01376]RSM62848.1 MarR family transcriptional regulator [Amycolatopsis sp. WAC 01376]